MKILPLDPETIAAARAGEPDANGTPPERMVSDGGGYPCRSCLCDIPAGKEMLLFAARPFASSHAYAETGPVFICAETCTPWDSAGLPPTITARKTFLLRGYSADERIIDGTGGVVPTDKLLERSAEILAEPGISSVHIRSSSNSCYQARIDAPVSD